MPIDFATAESAVFVRQAAETRRAYATWQDSPVEGEVAPPENQAFAGTGPSPFARRQGGSDQTPLDPRHLGRELAARTPAEEVTRLMSEHRRLAVKKVKQGLTAQESRALQLVRWNLDRVEDAQIGHGLDELERKET
jgi:hypothetical protein